MKWTKKIYKTTITALSAMLIMVAGGGISGTYANASAASTPCDTGDQGLLQALQNKHSGQMSTPLSFSDV